MFTEPIIVNQPTLEKRAYIKFYFHGVFQREYTGNKIGKKIYPNSARSLQERDSLLIQLRNEFYHSLVKGEYNPKYTPPSKIITHTVPVSSKELLEQSLEKKLKEKLSRSYKRDLKDTCNKFLLFLNKEELRAPLDEISLSTIEKFLTHYGTSNKYYMNKHTELSVLFSTAGRILDTPIPTVKRTEHKSPKSVLNKPYFSTTLSHYRFLQLRRPLPFERLRHWTLYSPIS